MGSDRDVCIVGVARTPCGSFQGKLSSFSAVDLSAIAIKAALERAGITGEQVDEVILGHVISAGNGQAPARQASIRAGIPSSVPCTTVNKVCASGMKAIMFGAQAIALGLRDVVVTGGMESMSQAPHLSKTMRKGARFGDFVFSDALQVDGLNDAFDNVAMGEFAEECAAKYNISREEQDRFAAESYRRSLEATRNGKLKSEIVPVEVVLRRGAPPSVVDEDEEVMLRRVTYESLAKLRTCFKSSGSFPASVTAGNASTISDGAAALLLMSRERVEQLKLHDRVIALIRGFDDAAQDPRSFTTSPALAIPLALERANLAQEEVDFFEINEAFSVVALANTKLLNLNPERVNAFGGAVSIGHPLGCSGARIVVTLCSVLSHEKGRIGCAAVCNGGGGASAIVIERASF